MVVLQGFVDESDKAIDQKSGNVYLLARFVATAPLWEEFSVEWERICAQEPKTPDFHMRHAHRLKQYKWTEPQRDKRIGELVALIRGKANYRIDAVLAKPNYERIVRGKIPKEIDDPYFILFYNVILAMAEFMDLLGLSGKVRFVFDKYDPVMEGRCVDWYNWIKGHVASRVSRRLGGTPNFEDDKEVLPLKAADLFAWQIRRHLNEEQPRGLAVNDTLDSIMGMHGVSCNVRGEDLENLVSSITHGLFLQSHAGYLLPHSEEVRRNLRIRKLSISASRN
jgi:hypothetical protein